MALPLCRKSQDATTSTLLKHILARVAFCQPAFGENNESVTCTRILV